MWKRVTKLFILFHCHWSMTQRTCPRKGMSWRKEKAERRREKVERRKRRVERDGRKQKRLILQMKRLQIVVAPQTFIVTDEDYLLCRRFGIRWVTSPLSGTRTIPTLGMTWKGGRCTSQQKEMKYG